jgi:hypothetical protein
MFSRLRIGSILGAAMLSTVVSGSAMAAPSEANRYEFTFAAPQSASFGETVSFVATIKPEYLSNLGYRLLLVYPEKYLQFEPIGSDQSCQSVLWSYGSVVCEIKPSETRKLTIRFKAIGSPCNNTRIAVQQEFGAADATEEIKKEYRIDYAGNNASGCTKNADLALNVHEPVPGKSFRSISIESSIENTGDEMAENVVLRLVINHRVFAPRRTSIRLNGTRISSTTTPESCDESTGTCDSALLMPLGNILPKEKKMVEVPFRLHQRCSPETGIIAHFDGEVQTATPDGNKSNNFGGVTFAKFCPKQQ